MIWFQSTRVVALAAVVLGLAAAPAAVAGTPWSVIWRPGGLAVGILLDVVSVSLMVFVGVLAWVVVSYSRTNLRGRGRLDSVGGVFFLTLVTLLLTVTGASLVSIAIGWTASGLAVAGLIALAGTPEAPAAARVMRRTLLVGDAFLWSAVVVGLLVLPSLERSRLDEVESGGGATAVALLLLGACVARSGLVPAHRWLPETAEAPSPVSAMLHAGVVNGAGVLTLLTWPLMAAAPLALLGLLALGAASVVLGVWAGRVRTDVKGRLACSTTAQMGYMCVQLGLGLPAAALLHLIGHGAYKSWRFLRAGGAVGRTSSQVLPTTTPSAARGLHALLAMTVAGATGLVAITHLVAASGLTALVPVLLCVGAAGLAGLAVSGLSRVGRLVSWGVATTAGVVAGAYLWILLAAEEVVAMALPPGTLWAPGAALALVVLTVAVAAVVTVGARRLAAHPDGALALALIPTALAPTRHSFGRRRLPLPTPVEGRIEGDTVLTAVRLASSVVGPAWPLRNFVAANSLARLETMPFDDALDIAGRAHAVTGRASLSYFLDQFDGARITPAHVASALAEPGLAVTTEGGWTVEELVSISRDLVSTSPHAPTTANPEAPTVSRFCEGLPTRAADVTARVDAHSALWAQRAWSSATWHDDVSGSPAPPPGPWVRWRQAAEHPAYDRVVGVHGAAAAVATLPTEPVDALITLAGWADLQTEDLMGYLVATFASAPGWSGHAAWRARALEDPSPLVEWAALRMAHDLLLSAAEQSMWPGDSPGDSPGAFTRVATVAPARDGARRLATSAARVWQRALEIGIEDWLLAELSLPQDHGLREDAPASTGPARPTSQSVWCIDVRSERMRRHLEDLGEHHTYGYAGFFGAALRHVDDDGISLDCCPALISPSFEAHDQPTPLTLRQVVHRTATSVSRHPLGALMVAEAGGGLAAAASLGSQITPRAARRVHRSWTQGADASVRQAHLRTDLDLDARVALAAAALRTIGLTSDFAPVLLICGHGASMENNAFASAYDCGACGGNSGRVNALLLAEVLNDPEVRAQLFTDGIELPDDTVAVAALHDTTTDQVRLLAEPESPTGSTFTALDELLADLETAGLRSSEQRRSTLPARASAVPVAPHRRAADWSEPTPEWGLAGNAAIVIGPRPLSVGADLGGRVFLHSYDRDTDPEGAVLEVLLTAPLVVAQWINAQYYLSAVEPTIWGAGDKACHNVIGDVGVIQGAHGDLRTGLPWQALFRDEPGTAPDIDILAHEPVRLLAVVVADPDLIMRAVGRHDVLKQLVGNQWISLVCADRGRLLRLHTDLTWQPCRDAPRSLPRPYVDAPLGSPQSAT